MNSLSNGIIYEIIKYSYMNEFFIFSNTSKKYNYLLKQLIKNTETKFQLILQWVETMTKYGRWYICYIYGYIDPFDISYETLRYHKINNPLSEIIIWTHHFTNQMRGYSRTNNWIKLWTINNIEILIDKNINLTKSNSNAVRPDKISLITIPVSHNYILTIIAHKYYYQLGNNVYSLPFVNKFLRASIDIKIIKQFNMGFHYNFVKENYKICRIILSDLNYLEPAKQCHKWNDHLFDGDKDTQNKHEVYKYLFGNNRCRYALKDLNKESQYMWSRESGYGFNNDHTKNKINSNHTKNKINKYFVKSCKKGQISLAKSLLHYGSQMNMPIDIHYNNDSAYIRSYFDGRSDIMNWLAELGNISNSPIDLNICKDNILYNYCQKNMQSNSLNSRIAIIELDLLKKLLRQENIEFDIRNHGDILFILCCSKSNFDVANWLIDYGSDVGQFINVHAENDEAFIASCATDKLEVIIWLFQLYEKLNDPILPATIAAGFQLTRSQKIAQCLLNMSHCIGSPIDIDSILSKMQNYNWTLDFSGYY